jgi:hypothetical protein
MPAVGAQHASFSDIPIMLPFPIRKSTAHPIINVIKTIALSFLDDTLSTAICDLNTRKLEIRYDRSWFRTSKPKRGLVGWPSDVVIHRWGLDADILGASRETESRGNVDSNTDDEPCIRYRPIS